MPYKEKKSLIVMFCFMSRIYRWFCNPYYYVITSKEQAWWYRITILIANVCWRFKHSCSKERMNMDFFLCLARFFPVRDYCLFECDLDSITYPNQTPWKQAWELVWDVRRKPNSSHYLSSPNALHSIEKSTHAWFHSRVCHFVILTL